MNTIPTRIENAILIDPVIEIVPSAGTRNPQSNWRERAKLGKPSMFYSITGTVLAGDAAIKVTVNDIGVRFNEDGTFLGLGVEPEGLDADGHPVPQSQVSNFQADHCLKFHVDGEGNIVFDEAIPEGIDPAWGVKHFVYRAQGKTLALHNLRLTLKDDPRFADGFCDGYEVVDEPKAVAHGPARTLTMRAPKTVVYRSEQAAARKSAAAASDVSIAL